MNRGITTCLVLAFTVNTHADTLVHEAIIDAPLADVWAAFTQEQHITQWMVPLAEVDFHIGGTLRTNYKPEGVIGDDNTIEHRFLAFEHERMLAMQVTKCPADFPFHEEVKRMWSVMYFDPLTRDRTHLRIVGVGYGTGGNWDRMRAFFQQGNEWELQKLKEYFANRPDTRMHTPGVQLDSHLAPLKRFLGGQWEVRGTWSSGEPLHARTIYELGVGGRFIQARTYAVQDDGTEYQRYETLYGWNTGNETLTYTRYAADGNIAEGTITSTDADTLSYRGAKGSPSASGTIGQTIEFLSNDEARWIVWLETVEAKQQLIDATWNRTSIAPLELDAIMESLSKE